MTRKILVVDDEQVVRDLVSDVLGAEHRIETARNVVSGLALLREQPPDLLISDVRMPGGDGTEFVRQVLEEIPGLSVIVISGHATIEDFVSFLHVGVVDCILKPFTPDELKLSVARAFELDRLRAENERIRASLPSSEPRLEALVGESSAMRAVKKQLASVAETDATVLITGSSGTGKELAARAVHDLSDKRDGPFVPVNCGALPENLLESELFGHVRGAFTGAERSRPGRFEEADGGTLFLDEIGTTTEPVQVRLLRVLSTREVTRVGDERARKVDVRIVAATNADLAEQVRLGTFREDLLYRLNVFPVRMPDLADHLEDLPLLAVHLLEECCLRLGRPSKRLSDGAIKRLQRHRWPGNVRELENTLERAVILAGEEDVIEADDVFLSRPPTPKRQRVELPGDGIDLPGFLSKLERDYLRRALERTGGNKQAAARLLGLRRTTLVQKLRRQRDQEASD